MRLDARSIVKAAAWGLAIAVAGSILFRFVHLLRVEAIFNVVLGGGIGFLFGRITIRNGGDDGFSAMAVGGGLAAVVPVVIAWLSSMAVVSRDVGFFRFVLNPSGLFAGLVFGGITGIVTGVIGGLIYASRF
jgi:hypothetical protein